MKVLVTGATGAQGGQVARLLLQKGHTVLALTRNADSAAAKELVKQGAKIVTGDLLDKESVKRAAQGVDAIFGVTNFVTPKGTDCEGEVQQGITLADVAKANGQYLVFTSVAHADRNTGIPHFESKYKVEQYIEKIGLPAAIIGPGYFMDNLFTRDALKNALHEGYFLSCLPPDKLLGQICVEDIAGMAVLALENKEKFAGKGRIDIYSENLTGEQCAQILTKILGRPIQYKQLPLDAIKQDEEYHKMFTYFATTGLTGDTDKLRKQYPEVGWHTFESWAANHKH